MIYYINLHDYKIVKSAWNVHVDRKIDKEYQKAKPNSNGI